MSKQEATADPAFLEQQRKRLVAMRDQLVGRSTAEAARQRVPRGEEAREIEDDAQDMAQREVDGTIDAVEEDRLRAIERALAKIDEGTYGLSDLSGDPIPKARNGSLVRLGHLRGLMPRTSGCVPRRYPSLRSQRFTATH